MAASSMNDMRKTTIYILLILISIIFGFYKLLKKDTLSTGFERKFVKSGIKLEAAIDLPSSSFDILNFYAGEILLKNHRDPFNLLKLDSNLKSMKTETLKLPKEFITKPSAIDLDVQNDKTFITNRNGNFAVISDVVGGDYYKGSILNNDNPKMVSLNSVIVRSIINNETLKGIQLNKLSLNKKVSVKETYLLPKQVDGIFCADGMLIYDRKAARLIYLYYYRGEFLSLDTNLKILFKAKTIDTISFAKIKLAPHNVSMQNGIKVKGSTISTVPNLVNRNFTINRGCVYILSNIKADNENTADFRNNHPIDVYSANEGKYIHSFYIPRLLGIKLKNFKIDNHHITAIYDKKLVLFKFKNNMKNIL